MQVTLDTDAQAFELPRVREDAMVMIRRLIRLLETFKPLPEEKVLVFKLFYYDDKTPVDYNPPHFHDSTLEVHPFFAAPPLKVAIGGVSSVRARASWLLLCVLRLQLIVQAREFSGTLRRAMTPPRTPPRTHRCGACRSTTSWA